MKNDGGPAFPNQVHCSERDGDHVERWVETIDGMSMRDYFAAKAMNALLSVGLETEKSASSESIANAAYRMADAMIEARAR